MKAHDRHAKSPSESAAFYTLNDRKDDFEVKLIRQKKLMCVDDDKHTLRSLQRLFRSEAFTVLTADNSSKAFELLKQETIDVVMVDQRMPDMMGTEFLEKVKMMHPTTVRVMLSGYSEVESVLEVVNRGEVYRFLAKPWDDDAIKTTILQCFEQHELLDRQLTCLRNISGEADRNLARYTQE